MQLFSTLLHVKPLPRKRVNNKEKPRPHIKYWGQVIHFLKSKIIFFFPKNSILINFFVFITFFMIFKECSAVVSWFLLSWWCIFLCMQKIMHILLYYRVSQQVWNRLIAMFWYSVVIYLVNCLKLEKSCLNIHFHFLQFSKKAQKAIFWSKIHFFENVANFACKLLSNFKPI